MCKTAACFLVLLAGFSLPTSILAQDEIVDETFDDEVVIEGTHSSVPVRPAILTRRYGHLETEPEVAAEELEAGYGATNTFKFVHWHRYYRPFGWYGYYGPRYYVGYRPAFYGYYGGYYPSYAFGYPAYGYSMYTPYWGGYYGATPYTTFYAPPVYYGGYGGCFYW